MKKHDFLAELGDYLELENLNESSKLELTSMSILSVIALVDENFDKQLNASDLKSVRNVLELMNLIGTENFSE
jgi:acyl carrier protein